MADSAPTTSAQARIPLPRGARLALGGIAAVYLACGALVWKRGGAAEDAYILFKYARMVAAGHGITFYPHGPPSEGATDFLWMLLLSAGAAIGASPALTGLVLDAVGLLVVAWVLLRRIDEARTASARAVGWMAVATLPSMPFAVAGLLGFGSTFYAALALGLYLAFVERAAYVPWLALTVALVRPDGAVLAAGFAALQAGQLVARRGRLPSARAILSGWAAAALIGLGYFFWRWHYFGQPLPLPLSVKRHFPLPAPGLRDMLDWVASTALPAASFALGVRWLWGRVRLERRERWGVLPFALHLAAFVHTTPSQNIVNRFEAPAELLGLYLVVSLATRAPQPTRAAWRDALVVGGFVLVLVPRWLVVRPEWTQALHSTHYATRFGRALGSIARERGADARRLHLATTEAGRLAYELDGPVLDLVGLCSVETANVPPTFALLDQFDADVIIVHPAGTIDEHRIDGGSKQALVPVSAPMAPMLWPAFADRAVAAPAPYPSAPLFGPPPAGLIENIRGAPAPVLAWLDRHHERFTVHAIGIPARYARYHLVAVRIGLPEHDAIVEALRASSAAATGETMQAMLAPGRSNAIREP